MMLNAGLNLQANMAGDLTFTIRAPREVEMVPEVDGTIPPWREAIKRENRFCLELMVDWPVSDSPNGTVHRFAMGCGVNF